MIAAAYNAAQAGKLWQHAQLPQPLPALDPGSDAFTAAVVRYQSTHGLLPDGRLGPVTWARMQREAATPPAYVLGIDVSAWQPTIDWPAVAAAGARFAFVKATQGEAYVSRTFAAQVQGAHAAGLPVGAYHFAVPEAADSPEREADHFLGEIDGQPLELPPVLDFETHSKLDRKRLTAWACRFVSRVRERTGRLPIFYTYSAFNRAHLRAAGTVLVECPLWIAQYSTAAPKVAPWPAWSLWQYTGRGKIAGIKGNVDLNRCTAATLAALRGA